MAGAAALATCAALLPWAELSGQEGEASGRHEVERGDTLWDLAARYLSDPFAWPRIFELNRGLIEDPHWIYPGQRLALPGAAAPADVTAVEVRPGGEGPEAGARAEGAPPGEDPFAGPSLFDRNPETGVTLGGFEVEETRPLLLVSPSDFYRAAFLGPEEGLTRFGTTRRVIRENPLGLDIPASMRLHNRVVLGVGNLGAEVGDTLHAVREGRSIGGGRRIYHSVGLVEVLSRSGDSARARVVAIYGDYRQGDPVIPLRPYRSVEAGSLEEAEDHLVARVLGLEVEQVLAGLGDLVFLDVGEEQGVAPGDEFLVYPEGTANPGEALPEERLAVVRVVRVEPEAATARIVDMREVGTRAGLLAVRARRAGGLR